MSTLITSAPVQGDRAAWHDTRVGRFTASTIGALMTEPRSKADKDAGKFGQTAMSLIMKKAVERINGRPVHTHADFSMKRGTLLEHAMIHLLNKYGTIGEIAACTWQPLGTNSGATPDGLLEDGSPVDLKCPQSEVDVYAFGDAVQPDGSWEQLLEWNKDYAWQVATQAMAVGSKYGTLIYATDKMPWVPITGEDVDTCNDIMEAVAEKLTSLTGQIYDYRLSTENGAGFAYVARTVEVPEYAFERIASVLERAEAECTSMVERLRMVRPTLNTVAA